MTEHDRRILAAADLPAKLRRAAAADLGLTSPAFHQRLLRLIHLEEAEAEFPVTVHRQRRLQSARRHRRKLGKSTELPHRVLLLV